MADALAKSEFVPPEVQIAARERYMAEALNRPPSVFEATGRPPIPPSPEEMPFYQQNMSASREKGVSEVLTTRWKSPPKPDPHSDPKITLTEGP